MEGEKQLYAAIKQPVMVRKPYRIPINVVKPAMGMKAVMAKLLRQR